MGLGANARTEGTQPGQSGQPGLEEEETQPGEPGDLQETDISSVAAEVDDGAVWCPACEMWLNGPAQWDDHQIGKKHGKNVRRAEAKARLKRA